MTTITVPGVPVAQPRQRMANIGGFLKNYTPTRDPVNAWKASIRLAWHAATSEPPATGPIHLRIAFAMPRPQRLGAKKYSGRRVPHDRRPDADNLVKATKDALTGLAWRDDSQVFELYCLKQYAAADEQPHAVIEVIDCGEAAR